MGNFQAVNLVRGESSFSLTGEGGLGFATRPRGRPEGRAGKSERRCDWACPRPQGVPKGGASLILSGR